MDNQPKNVWHNLCEHCNVPLYYDILVDICFDFMYHYISQVFSTSMCHRKKKKFFLSVITENVE